VNALHPHEVVVTGVGTLGGHGIGLPALARALASGAPHQTLVDTSANYHRHHGARLRGSCADLDLSPWLSPQQARRMSDLSQFAVAATRMALHESGLEQVRGERTAVAIATTFGPGGFTEQLARQILEKGGKAASPFLFTDCVANAAAGQIGIEFGAKGPNTTICQREAGPVLALAQGIDDIATGRADVCLAGAVDEMKPLVHALLDRFRALARPLTDGELGRPFDQGRNGAFAGEGATVLVLERADRARARGARVLARCGRTVRAFDPTATRAGFGRDGASLAATLRARAAAELAETTAIVSGASGTRSGDALEARVLRAALPKLPPVVAPKAVHGEYGGGTLAAGILALQGAPFRLPLGCRTPDPALDLPLHDGPLAAGVVMLSALSAGGAAAWTFLYQP
jgi:3-oxoacyl-[acyl-carrier-protein] synthase II